LYDEEGNEVDKITQIQLNAAELTQVPSLIGKDLPAAFLLNSEDWGFGYFELDLASVKVFEDKLGKVKDSLNRAVIISNIIAMMR
jgi:aminopeptidase N